MPHSGSSRRSIGGWESNGEQGEWFACAAPDLAEVQRYMMLASLLNSVDEVTMFASGWFPGRLYDLTAGRGVGAGWSCARWVHNSFAVRSLGPELQRKARIKTLPSIPQSEQSAKISRQCRVDSHGPVAQVDRAAVS